MRPIWKGHIAFGLVTIPVRVYVAQEAKDVRFRQLHAACLTPIKQVRRCPRCGRDVEWDEVVRGYEYEKGRFVPVTDEDLQSVPLPTKGTVDLFGFVQLQDIDPLYYERAYYLAPDVGGAKAFKLLQEALASSGRVGVGKVALREKEHLVALRPYGDTLVMEVLYYPDEIRAVSDLPEFPLEVKVHPNERKMAVQLVEGMTMEFHPGEYRDEYREALLRVIRAKAEGAPPPQAAPPAEEKVVDLMEALRRSLEMAKQQRARRVEGSPPPKRVAAMRERHK
ncbi:MAG: Ku protein [Armatimonadota bacterium]|nr:Ku protein [Armatimonadota bacterium]MDW8155530.1 Ku protein [Armatimonadota bacterium]